MTRDEQKAEPKIACRITRGVFLDPETKEKKKAGDTIELAERNVRIFAKNVEPLRGKSTAKAAVKSGE